MNPSNAQAQARAAFPAADASPELYWSPCPDTNRAFLSLVGVDNNVAEVFPVEHIDYISAADVACRISRRYNAHPDLVAALSDLLDYLDGKRSGLNHVRDAALAALASAQGGAR